MRIQTRRIEGSALLATVMMLVLIGAVGFAALETVTRERQVAGYQMRERMAFYAAEAGVAEALGNLARTGTPTVTNGQSVGDPGSFPYGRPSYQPDPTAADPLDDLGGSPIEGFEMNVGQDASPTFQLHYWRVRVQGQEPAGSTARLEVLAARLE